MALQTTGFTRRRTLSKRCCGISLWIILLLLLVGCSSAAEEAEDDVEPAVGYADEPVPSDPKARRISALVAELRVSHELRTEIRTYDNPDTRYSDYEIVYYPTPVMTQLIRVGRAALPALKKELAEAEGEHLGAILFVLAKIGGEGIFWTIVSELDGEHPFYAIRALGVLGDARAVPFLGSIALNPKSGDREPALEALARIADLSVIPIFIALLDDPHLSSAAEWDLRRWGIRGVSEPGSPDVASWRKWWLELTEELRDRWRGESEYHEWLYSWPYTREKVRILREQRLEAVRERIRRELEADPNARQRVR